MRRLLAMLCIGACAARAAVPGGIAVLDVPEATERATYEGHAVLVLHAPRPVAIVGIPLDARLGQHRLTVEASTGAVAALPTPFEIAFPVTAKEYPTETLTVEPKLVNPPAKELARIKKEQAAMQQVFASFTPVAAPPFPMLRPLAGETRSAFGLRRVFNGEPRSPHSGLDIRGAVGDPIAAPAAGTVALTGLFYFNGNTVLIDHGGGVVTMTCHMSEIDVARGQHVERGQVIGKVGATGRVTGPHLHWTLSLNDARVDPEQALSIFAASPTAARDEKEALATPQ